jgi:hypothetical protein
VCDLKTEGSSQSESKEDSSEGDGTKEDYVHVRAKRGQATNSHILAERVSCLLLDKYLSLQLTLCSLLMLEVDEPLCRCGGKR